MAKKARRVTQADYRALAPKLGVTCECCSRAGIDRPGKLRGRGVGEPVLCEPCWTNPANRFDECNHKADEGGES